MVDKQQISELINEIDVVKDKLLKMLNSNQANSKIGDAIIKLKESIDSLLKLTR